MTTPTDSAPADAASRTLAVVHETVYRYERPVERSEHMFRLRPLHDALQQVLKYDVAVSPAGDAWDFEDLFGNRATHYIVPRPFSEMRIESRSLVRLNQPFPLTPPSPYRGAVVPLTWIPSEREVLLPYLDPPELPEHELRELYEYAVSFAERHQYDLLDTALDMAKTIRQEFTYERGATSVETTAYETYRQRRGVCQDFANLLICMARLLQIPARYQVGYIFTGGDYENKLQSEASHAWVECYLPWIGWRGFDPTNGCTAGIDHVRVAAGRNYRDAAPTSGTLHSGGGTETLTVRVRVEAAEDPNLGPRVARVS